MNQRQGTLPTTPLLGVDFHHATMDMVVEAIYAMLGEGTLPCRYVVPINVNMCVAMRSDAQFRQVVAEADLRVVDSRPVLLLSRLLGPALPGVVPGSDLVPALFGAAEARGGLDVYLLGAMPGVGARAAEAIRSRWPAVRVVGVDAPPRGFENDPEENRRILERIERARPQLLILGLGAPKQEKWIHHHRADVRAGVALCAGATIDFLAGEQTRAPRWVQRANLEWLYRMLSQPRRLAGRYVKDGLAMPGLIAEECRRRKGGSA
jgi:N-acetylglucosaminyldiphosphoundecaprenol N-acetyl-beta-D-mannosaminyltransferase